MKTFMSFIKEQQNDHDNDFDKLKTNLTDMGVSHSLSHNKNGITVSKLVVDKDKRNTGIGTSAMKAITSHADKYGKRIALTPSSDFGGSKTRLVPFYKRHGFVENKGRNKDYSISDTMYREPNK